LPKATRIPIPARWLPLAAFLLAMHAAATAAEDAAGWANGNHGWEWSAPASGSYFWAGLRFQSRYDTHPDEILLLSDLDKPGASEFRINRARYKIGAGYARRFTFYHE